MFSTLTIYTLQAAPAFSITPQIQILTVITGV
jgi:hypothetical protein